MRVRRRSPQIILHAYQPNTGVINTTGGEVQPSTDVSADYGSKLVVNDAPDIGGDAGSLILFNSTVGKTLIETKVKKNNTKKEKTKVSQVPLHLGHL